MSREFARRYGELTNQEWEYTFKQDESVKNAGFKIVSGNIIYKDVSGLRNAINYLNRNKVDINSINQEEAPEFEIRGVIEGFYGKPWSHNQRKKGLKHFAKYNMNSFVLAPKDDPWQRFDWRTKFNESFLKSTKELVELAKDLVIDLSVCVSPGLTIRYSSDEDIESLLVRYRQLADIGVTRFGLLLDDIPWSLQFPEDQSKFKNIAAAHAHLANEVLRKLAEEISGASLFVCPLQYHGRGNEPYISEFGQALNANIDLMWTGRQICSEYLDIFDADKFYEGTAKRPLYWDNFPVNDVAMIHQLHVGPIKKREVGLGGHARGLLANPMEHFESSLIPIATIGDYLWNSKTYNAEKSWDSALSELLIQSEDREAIRHLFRNCFESCLAVDPAPEFNSLLGAATLAWRTGKPSESAAQLESHANAIESNYQRINSSNFTWPEITSEISRWLKKYREVGQALLKVAEVLKASQFSDGRIRGSVELANQVREIRNSLAKDPTRIFGDGLDLTLGELATELSAA
jgi:hyaluronoglucosaminidase